MAYKLEVYEYGMFVIEDGVRTYVPALNELQHDDKGNYYYMFRNGEEMYYLVSKLITKVNPLDFYIDENNVFHDFENTYELNAMNYEDLADCGNSMIDTLYNISVLKVLDREDLQDSHTRYTWSIEISSIIPDSTSVNGKKIIVYNGTLTGVIGGE